MRRIFSAKRTLRRAARWLALAAALAPAAASAGSYARWAGFGYSAGYHAPYCTTARDARRANFPVCEDCHAARCGRIAWRHNAVWMGP